MENRSCNNLKRIFPKKGPFFFSLRASSLKAKHLPSSLFLDLSIANPTWCGSSLMLHARITLSLVKCASWFWQSLQSLLVYYTEADKCEGSRKSNLSLFAEKKNADSKFSHEFLLASIIVDKRKTLQSFYFLIKNWNPHS